MPVVRMPDGKLVRFPENMDAQQIHDFVVQRFPNAYDEPEIPEFTPQMREQAAAMAEQMRQGKKQSVAGAALSGLGEGVISGAGRLASGATLGATDWIDRKTGGHLQALDDRLQRRADSAGLGTANKIAKFGTEVVGNIGGAGGAITKGLAKSGLKGAGLLLTDAGVQGGVMGATSSDRLDDLGTNVVASGLESMVFGAGMHGMIKTLASAGSLLRSDAKKGMEYLRRFLGDEAVNKMIADAENSGRSLAEVADDKALEAVQLARQQTPDARYAINKNAEQIRAAEGDKSRRFIDETLGNRGGFETTQEVAEAAKRDAAPIYQELEKIGDLDPEYTARANKTAGGKLSKQDADAILKQEFGKIPTKEQPNMRQPASLQDNLEGISVGNNIPSLGELVNSNEVLADTIKRVKRANSSLKNLADTDFKVINEARRALSQASLNKMDISGYEARQALKELDPVLDKIIPQYAEARKIYEGAHQFEQAAEMAQDIFKTNISEPKFRQAITAMSDKEKQALKLGMRDELYRIIGNRENETMGWKRIVPEEVQKKIRLVLGDKEGNRLIAYGNAEIRKMRNLNKVLQGSQTSEKQNLRDAVETGQRILDNPTGALGAVSRRIPWNNARNRGIAEIMTKPSADVARQAYQAVTVPKGWEAVYQALYNTNPNIAATNAALAAYLGNMDIR